jgi:hypothetical protein
VPNALYTALSPNGCLTVEARAGGLRLVGVDWGFPCATEREPALAAARG